jgi:mycoredoxin
MTDIVIYTTRWCSDCHRAKYLLDQYGIAYREVDVEQDAVGLAVVQQINQGRRTVPTILFADGSVLVEPSNEMLAEKLGLTLDDGLL